LYIAPFPRLFGRRQTEKVRLSPCPGRIFPVSPRPYTLAVAACGTAGAAAGLCREPFGCPSS